MLRLSAMHLKSAVCLLGALALFNAPMTQAREDSVAVFQFTAESMDVVGLENEVAYAMRNELSKRDSVILVNQREMEVELARNDIAQTFDSEQALLAGQTLNVNYVIIGKVGRSLGKIAATIELVSSASQGPVNSWSFKFSNQQEVANRSEEMGDKIIAAISSHHAQLESQAQSIKTSVWAEQVVGDFSNGMVYLTWIAKSAAPAALGYNIYRGNSADGPFSYIDSALEDEYNDDVNGLKGNVFYQIALLTEDGEELRSDKVVQVNVQHAQQSNIEAPIVISFTPLIRGAQIELIPSAQNTDENIIGYQFLRRSPKSSWQVVGEHKVDKSNKSNSRSNAATVEKISLSDTQSATLNGEVEYAVRAVAAGEQGKISDVYSYAPVVSPEVNPTSVAALREISLSWTPVKAGSGYVIYRKSNEDDAWQSLAKINSIQLSQYIDRDISEDGKTFEYALAVFDQYGESAPSKAVKLASKAPLAPPEGIKGQSGLARKAVISWQHSSDPDLIGYGIYRAEYSDNSSVMLTKIGEVLQPSADQYIDNNQLLDGQSYQYAVASINRFNSAGDLTEAITVTTKTPPPAPQSVAAQIDNDQVIISWQHQHLDQIEQFKIERSWQQSQWHEVGYVTKQQSQFIDNNLLAGGVGQYRISAIDNDNLQSEAVLSSSIVIPNTLELQVAKNNLLRKVELSWLPTKQAHAINILRQDNADQWQLIATLEPEKVNFSDAEGLIDDSEYSYKLQTVFEQNIVAESNLVVARTKNIPPPETLSIVSGQARQISLNWSPLDDSTIKSYLIYRWEQNQTSTDAVLLAEITADNSGVFVDRTDDANPIIHGKNYTYALASRNVFEAIGPLGTPASGASKPLPMEPKQLTVQAGQDHIALQWDTGDEVDLQNTEIYRRWAHQTQWQKIATINASQSSYTDAALLPYAKAYYKVRLSDADQLISAYSDEVEQTSPLAVELQAASQNVLRKSNLQWNNNEWVDEYQVQRATQQSKWQRVGSLKGNQFADTKGLADQTTYLYKVIAVHQGTVIGESNTVSVATKPLPEPPQGFTATDNQVQQVSLSWQAIDDPDVAGYILYRLDNKGEASKLSTLKSNETRYEDDGGFFSKLDHGSYYSYVISAFNTYKAEGKFSDVIIGSTKSLPQQVSGLSVNLVEFKPVLEWQSSPETDIQSYNIYRGRDCSRTRKYRELAANQLTFSDEDVEAGKSYCYQVSALSTQDLEGELSRTAEITLPNNENIQ